MGGDCFLLHYDAATKKVSALNGSGRSAQALTLEQARKDCPGQAAFALDNVHAITVPGAVAGWVDAVDAWGSLTIDQVLRPAIDLAKSGFPVSTQTAVAWKRGYDLAQHTSTFVDPIKVSYEGVDVYEVPPNGQGITALMALNLLKQVDGDDWKQQHNSAQYLHTLIEVLRLAFLDTRWFVTDPAFEHVPVAELLSDEYAKARIALVHPDKVFIPFVDPKRGSPVLSSGTVSFQVVDGAGNAVSMVNSNYAGFGTGLIPQGVGFTLQNRGANFSLQHGHPNVFAPGKRPYHTIIPAVVVILWSSFMQPQGHVQVLLNQLLFHMDPQAALDVPRFCIGTSEGDFSYVYVEPGVDEAVVEALRLKGHAIRVLDATQVSTVGRGQIITKNPRNGVLCAGSDGRGDGLPMGW
ncbi:hypothetical protein DYB37_002454 [Aphanomyces astaci]|uniref:Gamma-glutamyltransferase n=3 Tax=Aphanomyces astaci TaxID=112090 RepID=A0A3R6XQ88_APHAT|nr:hypothetical protein DYB35_001737 [Aphanomyces astaci]RHZ08121.1 hypothetical protein DYB37_002454 [Aphanomyces astaci]